MKKMRILYAGDSEAGGPANYLLGVLDHIEADLVHVPPKDILRPQVFAQKFDAIILSDFPKKQTPILSEKEIARQVEQGAGLLMIGGWGSFTGVPLPEGGFAGGWHGSEVEKLLPVECLPEDDRLNYGSGLLMIQRKKHPMFGRMDFSAPPVLCGLNIVRPKKQSVTLLTANPLQTRGMRPKLAPAKKEYPLFVVNSDPRIRTAALSTDVAPHWCGGLVDWGERRARLRVNDQIWIEVGDAYVRFLSSILLWLSGRGF